MRKIKRFVLLACSVFCLSGALLAQNAKPFVIPELKEWKGGDGQFVPTASSRIVCASGEAELLRVAQAFAADYEEMFGVRMSVMVGKAAAGDFVFQLKADKKMPKEGYDIRITDRVLVSAPETSGVFWATRTLLQMTEQSDSRSLAKGNMRDFPSYAVRGFMLDVARKFFTIDFLRDYVKFMAYYKMNTFQIHLNDNGFKQYFEHDWNKTYAAFRLECDTYPGLTAEDGFYTKQEFIDLQKLAENNYVDIIPEIDAPAHALAFSHYKPEIGSQTYGMDHLDLGNPETYKFMDGLFKEYLEGENPVFRGKRVNIGTDEYSNKDKQVVEQFRAFTDHYIRYVEQFGKQACVWGALTHAKGDTPVKVDNVVMNIWHNPYAQPRDMKELGYKMISIPDGLTYIVPQAGYYYDYLNCQYLYENWTPAVIADQTFDENDPYVLGGMFAVWNDHVGNGISMQDVHHRVFPAMQTLAVKMWTGKDAKLPYADFNQKRLALSEAPGVNILGRIGEGKEMVYETAVVTPGMQTPYREVGYDYTVSFDIEGADEAKGTELFRSRDAVFYLADPISGMLGYARDGYLYTFGYRVKPGKVNIAIEGDNQATRLYIDGKLVEELGKRTLYYNEGGKDKMYQSRTLVFPLEKAGLFSSRISNLKVYNYKQH